LIVRTIRLYEINYVEFVADVFLHVTDFKVVPLSVGCRAVVILQNKVVSVLADAKSSSQVSRLEPTFELKHIVILRLFLVIWL